MTATRPGELGWNDPNAINLELTICAFNFPVKSSFNYKGLWAFKHIGLLNEIHTSFTKKQLSQGVSVKHMATPCLPYNQLVLWIQRL